MPLFWLKLLEFSGLKILTYYENEILLWSGQSASGLRQKLMFGVLFDAKALYIKLQH